jgi:hypothetical protein
MPVKVGVVIPDGMFEAECDPPGILYATESDIAGRVDSRISSDPN